MRQKTVSSRATSPAAEEQQATTVAMLAQTTAYMCMLCLFISPHSVAGQSSQQQFQSVGDALAQLPQLSFLHTKLTSELNESSLFKLLQQPSFSGTFFAPVNSIFSALHNDISVLGDLQQLTDLFSTAVLPGRYTLSDLKHGAQLATLNGLFVDVTIARMSTGPVHYVNNAQIITANIPAGNAILHLVTPLVAVAEQQDLVEALVGFAAPKPAPTVIWQDASQPSVLMGSAESAAPTTGDPDASLPEALQTTLESGIMHHMVQTGQQLQEASASQPPDNAPASSQDDIAPVNYIYEQDFQEAGSATGLQGSAINVSGLLASADKVDPAPATKNGAHLPAARMWLSPAGLLLALSMALALALPELW